MADCVTQGLAGFDRYLNPCPIFLMRQMTGCCSMTVTLRTSWTPPSIMSSGVVLLISSSSFIPRQRFLFSLLINLRSNFKCPFLSYRLNDKTNMKFPQTPTVSWLTIPIFAPSNVAPSKSLALLIKTISHTYNLAVREMEGTKKLLQWGSATKSPSRYVLPEIVLSRSPQRSFAREIFTLQILCATTVSNPISPAMDSSAGKVHSWWHQA